MNYQEGDQFKSIPRVQSVDECRLLCIRENNCKYYVWRGNAKRKPCLLKSSGLWLPKLETGTISGSVEFECNKARSVNEYGFCDCVELAPDYYDEEFIDLVETGLFDSRTNTCPTDQGRRCYIREPVEVVDTITSSRIFFGN